MRFPPVILLLSVLIAPCFSAEEDAPRAVPVAEAVVREEQGAVPDFAEGIRIVSRSEQFRVSGGTAGDRGAAAVLAEEVKEELLRLTEEEDDWKVPVVIELRGRLGDALPLRRVVPDLWFSEQGFELKVLVNLSRGLPTEEFRRVMTMVMVYERGVRALAREESEVALNVPPWLVEGLREAVAFSLNQANRRLYETLFRHGGLFRLEDVFELSEAAFLETDAASKAAFRVSSGALVMALLEQPDGKKGFREFLADVPAYKGEMPGLLRQHFPDMNLSQTSMARWWLLQLANKGTAPLSEAFTVAETERMLEEALRFRLRDDEGGLFEKPVGDWQGLAVLEEAERIDAVRLAQDDLLRLSYRCFPSYRVLLLEYQAILSDLARGQTGNIESSLVSLAETRQTMIERAERARDFMDWFEITRARETSGAFEDYLNLKERLKHQPNHRTDPMSQYLDRLDPLFRVPE